MFIEGLKILKLLTLCDLNKFKFENLYCIIKDVSFEKSRKIK